ncbi:MAG TPA: hypothetical protein VHL77_01315, partial [Ferruginibacter sp.]|nr:hypothetical protein [Ferruginibacter sp.]
MFTDLLVQTMVRFAGWLGYLISQIPLIPSYGNLKELSFGDAKVRLFFKKAIVFQTREMSHNIHWLPVLSSK